MGPFTAGVLRRGEREYVNEGVGSILEQLRAAIRKDPNSSLAPIAEMIALSSPLATYRTARSLTGDRRPTLREQLIGLGLPRVFVVGSRTLEAD